MNIIYMKKAQASGTGAGVLIIVISLMIILYILFLPPDDRSDLLDDNGIKDDDDSTASRIAGVILEEEPGTLLKERQERIEHKIPSFNLFSRKDDVIIKEVDSIYVESKSGSFKNSIIPLFIDQEVENAQLTLNVVDYKGRLIIKLNGNEIFNGAVDQIFDPISLENLQEENSIEISTPTLEWYQFFSTNYYEIRNLQITGTVETIDATTAQNTFIVSSEEALKAESAYLVYFVDCRVESVSKLTVMLNENQLASKIPDCGSPDRIDFDPTILNQGTNTLDFRAEKGTYLIDQIFIKTELEEPIFPVYFFEINQTQLDLVDKDELDIYAYFRFVDDGNQKQAEININNRIRAFTTRDKNASVELSSHLVKGSNFIEIEPKTVLKITKFTVEAVDKD